MGDKLITSTDMINIMQDMTQKIDAISGNPAAEGGGDCSVTWSHTPVKVGRAYEGTVNECDLYEVVYSGQIPTSTNHFDCPLMQYGVNNPTIEFVRCKYHGYIYSSLSQYFRLAVDASNFWYQRDVSTFDNQYFDMKVLYDYSGFPILFKFSDTDSAGKVAKSYTVNKDTNIMILICCIIGGQSKRTFTAEANLTGDYNVVTDYVSQDSGTADGDTYIGAHLIKFKTASVKSGTVVDFPLITGGDGNDRSTRLIFELPSAYTLTPLLFECWADAKWSGPNLTYTVPSDKKLLLYVMQSQCQGQDWTIYSDIIINGTYKNYGIYHGFEQWQAYNNQSTKMCIVDCKQGDEIKFAVNYKEGWMIQAFGIFEIT